MINQLIIPLDLKFLKQWVGHKNKIPMNPITYLAAESNNKETWGTFQQAFDAAKLNEWDGIGFVLQPPFVGLDLDDCVVDGKLNGLAEKTIKLCNSYTEYSPSGTGIHIICKGSISKALKTKELEIYNQGRYFTMTGDVIRPYSVIRTVDLSSLFPSSANIGTSIKQEGWIEEALNNIIPSNSTKGRTPTFLRIINSLKSRGLDQNTIKALLEPWAKKYEYKKLDYLIGDQFKRYPPAINQQNEDESVDSFLGNEEIVDWIIPNVIAKKSIGFVVGLPESRKTWLMIDLAIEMARGGLWLGKFLSKQGKVLYVDQERFRGETQRRFKSVILAKEMSPKEISSELHIRTGTATRLNLQTSFDSFKKKLSEFRPDLVIVDSFATFHTAEENNRQSIQDVLERVKQLRNEFGCTFIFIHHENKYAFNLGEEKHEPGIAQMSGSVAIPAAAEFVFTVRKQDSESSMVYNTKNTLSSSIAPFVVKVSDLDDAKTKVEVRAY